VLTSRPNVGATESHHETPLDARAFPRNFDRQRASSTLRGLQRSRDVFVTTLPFLRARRPLDGGVALEVFEGEVGGEFAEAETGQYCGSHGRGGGELGGPELGRPELHGVNAAEDPESVRSGQIQASAL